MPTPVRCFVTLMVGLGLGTITWGLGGLLRWDAPLLRYEDYTLMDARGAIGIGVGALAGAATALWLFRAPAPSGFVAKRPIESDLS